MKDEGTAATVAAVSAATLDTQPAPIAPVVASSGLPLADPGRYAVKEEYARGGIGRILRAFDHRLSRTVAIKEMLSTSDEGELRFRREALTTARLQHPAIVPVHDAGQWPGGRSFFAMKYVAGSSLDVALRDKPTLVERLALLPHVIAATDAIAYAHNENIIHRDIKPGNVLIGAFGETVVIDWGLAKDLTATDAPEVAVGPYRTSDHPKLGETVAGSVMGTPAYMPPEQARGEPVDARADVYALGALLYHLLAGGPPFTGRSVDDVLEAVLAGPPKPIDEVVPTVPAELAAIVHRAMAHDAADRYPTARELAEELRAFQAGKLVGAHRYTTRELVARWVRKHRGVVAASAIALVAIAIISVISFRRVLGERDRADEAARLSEERRLETAAALHASIESRDALVLETAKGQLDRDPTLALWTLARISDGGLETVRPFAVDAIARGIARSYPGADRRIVSVTASLDGTRAVTLEEDHALRLWDLASGAVEQLAGDTRCAMLTADGMQLIEVTGVDVGVRTLADRTRRQLATFDKPYVAGDLVTCAMLPDGRFVIAGDKVELWSLTAPPRRMPEALRASGVAASPDGVWIAAASASAVVMWNLGSDKAQRVPFRLPFARPPELRFSQDGRWLAAATEHGKIARWELSTGRSSPLDTKTSEVNTIAYAGDDLVAGCDDGTLVTWRGDVEDRLSLSGAVLGVAATRDLILAYTRTNLFALDRVTNLRRELRGHRDLITSMAKLPDGLLLTASTDHTLRRWDPRAGAVRSASLGVIRPSMATSPDGNTVVFGGKALEIVDVATDRRRRITTPSSIERVAVSRDGQTAALAIGGELHLQPLAGGTPRIVALADIQALGAVEEGFVAITATTVSVVPLTGAPRTACAISNAHASAMSATHVVLGQVTGRISEVAVCTLATGEVRWLDAGGLVTSVAISAERVIAGLDRGTLRIWTGASHRDVRGADGTIKHLAISPDGTRLASAGDDDSLIQITRLDDQAAVSYQLGGARGQVLALAWGRDGTTVLGADKAEVRVWDLASSYPIGFPIPRAAVVSHARGFAAATDDGGIYLWSNDVPREPKALRRWFEQLTQ